MTVLCVAAEHGGLIEKKEKESLWVKLNAFPTNVGPPNDVALLCLTPRCTPLVFCVVVFSYCIYVVL